MHQGLICRTGKPHVVSPGVVVGGEHPLNRETRRKIEDMVERVAKEWYAVEEPRIASDPNMDVKAFVNSGVMPLWSSYSLIVEAKRLRWLTVVLILLTAVLASLTLRLALI